MLADIDTHIQDPRRLAIGGSEVGAILGCDEMRDAFNIWFEKKQGVPSLVEPPMRVLLGQLLEPSVLRIYTHMSGRAVDHTRTTFRHPKRHWQIFTPDGLCTGERRGVEAKVVAWDQRYKWGERDDEIPDRVRLQCMYYMSALEYPVWDVIALIGDRPQIYTVERDEEIERAMLARVEEWYERFIVGDQHPPFTGSPSERSWLQMRFAEHKRPDLCPATEDEIKLLHTYIRVRRAQREATTMRGICESMLKEAIGEHEGLKWDTGRFTWRKTKDKSTTDYKRLAYALLTYYVKDQRERDKLIEEYTETTAGERRIRLTCDEEKDDNSDE